MRTKAIVLIGVLFMVAAALVYLEPWQDDESQPPIDWNLTLIGADGQQRILSYQQITQLPSYDGFGGYFSTVGLIYGPYDVRGVLLEDLCDLVGGIDEGKVVFISASDGYSTVFDYDRMTGDFDTFDPETMAVVPHGESRLVLMVEQNGKPLSYDDGRPLRIARIGPDDRLLIEGQYWVKWVNGIRIENLESS